MSEDAVTNLLKRVAELERLVGILARERDSAPPTVCGPIDRMRPMTPGEVQPIPYWPTTPVIPNMPAIGAHPRCPACGIELSPVIDYVCARGAECPTGLSGTICMGGA